MSDVPFTVALERMNRFHEPEMRAIIAGLGLPAGSRGLDVGCGVGLYTLWIAEAVGPSGRVLGIELTWINDVVRAKKTARLPVVLTVDEVQRALAELQGVYWLIASLLYGSGLRLMECLRLRVKDLDFEQRLIVVRSGKGGKDRVTVLPNSVVAALEVHLARRREQHRRGD